MSSGLALIRLLKGQMNQKIETFSFVALPSLNTKKKLPTYPAPKPSFCPK